MVERDLLGSTLFDVDDVQAAGRAFSHSSVQLATASGWSDGRYSFFPIVVDATPAFVIGVHAWRPSPEREKALMSAIGQTAAAISRLRLAREAEEARLKAERESLRSAILSSLSHDLRTPLATILGSVTSLRELGGALPKSARIDLLAAIEEDARRLNAYVGDLLHMTRLHAGLDLRLDWVDPRDVLNSAVLRIRRQYPHRVVEPRSPLSSTVLRTDFALLEQALFNCLDNAARIAPSDTPILATLWEDDGSLHFGIEDEGPGVSWEDRKRIFEPFQRGATANHNGTGLGLAIAKGIVTALGGEMGVDSPLAAGRGARFWLRFRRSGGVGG